MKDPSGFDTGGFRFNKLYKLGVTIVSELSLCCIFLHKVVWGQSVDLPDVHHKGLGGWGLKSGADTVMTCQWELRKLGGGVSGALSHRISMR